MGEAVANVARRINATVEEEKDTLDLSKCKLINFPDAVYKVLRSVTEKIHVITLANNEFKSLTSKFITNFSQLRELNLEGNNLTKLPDVIGTMLHLTTINLAWNKFTAFPEKLTDIKTLERINLEGNEITEVPMDKLAAMPSLQFLNMKSNPIKKEKLTASTLPITFELLTTPEDNVV
ncbi:LRC20 protein, partial [Polyodon spathula]|nr:leucine-rich repeat-containing protein 20-like isoform X1 [Polyodon spathula]XP_041124102.1 leucine-rich repeat-containing protein 20-like isoform X1 [Polyodon spathula]MBN3280906.1 LRC20 protein [Polyodon spathula]